jgi:peptide/nickel transport system permease protein
MIRYIIRRLLWAVVTLIIVSFVVFVIFYVLPPGDPAVLRAGHFPNPQVIVDIRHSLGLDRPFWVQYWHYIKAIVLHFDFGYSYQSAQPVKALIITRLPATVSLTVGAVVIWVSAGITVGAISAIRRRSLLDRLTMIASLLAISAPSFWLGLMALFVFSKDIGVMHVFDGAGTYVGLTANPGRWFGSLILPWLVLAASLAAFYARLLRSHLIEAMSQDYIRTARQGPARAAGDLASRRARRDHAGHHRTGHRYWLPARRRCDSGDGVQRPRGWRVGLRRHPQR